MKPKPKPVIGKRYMVRLRGKLVSAMLLEIYKPPVKGMHTRYVWFNERTMHNCIKKSFDPASELE